ncbi:MAG: DUF1080 domain-containing protein [Planctomycetia bacterium]|nr:DUF1080 domain-containing protein [Planctomycetia bacterium]
MRSIPSLLALAAICSVLCAERTCAQARPAAATSPEEAGPDFAFQGEYAGWISGGFRQRRVGWQVIALGQGTFRVVEYPGGLPGAGWNGGKKATFDAAREGAFVAFRGPGHVASIGHGKALLYDETEGRLRGVLPKVERKSPTLGASPPPGAVVLFDGSAPGDFQGAKVTSDGLLEVGGVTKLAVRDFRLHLEFRTPFLPEARGQARGNSGVYVQRRYEVQILDSFGLDGLNNECGGLYKQRAPAVNMCLPPLSWQTFDIDFRAARYDGARQTEKARITVRHNGVVIHDNVELADKTGSGMPEGPEPLPILLQNHGNPVHFRNIWLVAREEALGGK